MGHTGGSKEKSVTTNFFIEKKKLKQNKEKTKTKKTKTQNTKITDLLFG